MSLRGYEKGGREETVNTDTDTDTDTDRHEQVTLKDNLKLGVHRDSLT